MFDALAKNAQTNILLLLALHDKQGSSFMKRDNAQGIMDESKILLQILKYLLDSCEVFCFENTTVSKNLTTYGGCIVLENSFTF